MLSQSSIASARHASGWAKSFLGSSRRDQKANAVKEPSKVPDAKATPGKPAGDAA